MKENKRRNYEGFTGPLRGNQTASASAPPDSVSGWDELPMVEREALASMTDAFEREQMERWQEREHDRAA
jgi:hypothetical protein